ncbi:cancer-associated gene 1 protein isoform X8 [Mesocricetus auratus]|uniref:Cancer-associated gene 1 protein isoform X8 n=1 Tax=Mesocricetus auratus TaxID=10036 RepID=A0ABM2YE03_MESAU|nr:cancer-associated gene 1 protein isoform X8 [Mesocricetus auratus]
MEDGTKNAEREDESTPTFSEDIYSTQDSLLVDMNLGNFSECVRNQPANTRVSSLRQFEPICKFHWIEAFNDEMTFQDPGEASSYLEKPELQSQEYNDTSDASEKPDALKGESPMETSISENKDQPRSLSLNYYRRETQLFVENPQARSAVVDVALNISQPQSFPGRENVCTSGEDAFDSENCLDLLDLRANCETEEPEVSSKEIQNSGELSEMSSSHHQEVTEDGVDSLALASPWFPAGIFKNSRSQDNCMMPDRELCFESLEPLEEDMALNEALQKLKQTNKKQEIQIQDLHSRNLHLENRVKELQMKVIKQQVLVDIINKLKENIEELIDDKYNVLLEKNNINKKFQDLQEVSANTKKHLQESKKDKETLQLEVKKIKVHYVRLQERYIAEIQQKNKSVSQCLEIEKTLSKKDEELQRLQQHKGELEKATSSALDLLKREKEIREQEFLSFQKEFQRREKENLKERRKLKSRVESLMLQVKGLLLTCESEKAAATKLQQQVNQLKQENAELQQQAAKGEAQTCAPHFEIIQSRKQLEEVMEPGDTQVTDFDAEEARNTRDAPVLLAVRLDKYHNLNEELNFLITKLGGLLESKEEHYSRLIEENDKYRRHVGSLINKVTSYEEIIKCADQRLEISHSQIAYLEERNRHLEDLIRMPKEKVRRPRPRLENHPKSMTLVGHLDEYYKECSISM